jgi:hypothetical protein
MGAALAMGLMLIAMLAAGIVFGRGSRPFVAASTLSTATDARPRMDVAWRGAMDRLESAIEREDRAALLYEWRAAYAVGIAARSWEPMVGLGAAAQRIAALDRQREPFEREARGAYLLALRAARQAHSTRGLLATAEGFERLGDAGMAAQVRRLAARLHADSTEP